MNNIFTVKPDGGPLVECRIKGKVLKDVEDAYNPLSPGDRVEIELDPGHPGKAMILSRAKRKNAYSRWNKKRNQPQTLAANLDLLVLVTSPRFAAVSARGSSTGALIMAPPGGPTHPHPREQVRPEAVAPRSRTGWPPTRTLDWDVHLCSVVTGEGLDELKEHLAGLTSALVGQSGVGKSSLLNVLHEGSRQRIGEISAKYNRGSHTTNFSLLLPFAGEGGIIDTPGVRELEVFGWTPPSWPSSTPTSCPTWANARSRCAPICRNPGARCSRPSRPATSTPDRWDNYKKLFLELKEADRRWT